MSPASAHRDGRHGRGDPETLYVTSGAQLSRAGAPQRSTITQEEA